LDTIAHGLWAAVGALALGHRFEVTRSQVALAVALGVAPDIAQAVPVAGWALTQPEPIATFIDFAIATPGREVVMPDAVSAVSHHLHCALHSVFFAGIATLAAWRLRRTLLVPLAGWWLHIALDIPTHSASFYAVPFLYPFSDRTFDGIAWTTPWVIVANYLALAVSAVILAKKGGSHGRR